MFNIQISNPNIIAIRNKDDANLEEAIESIFPLENEFCFLNWNHIFIPITYKYDISCMIKDIISMVNFIKRERGFIVINWTSNTFSTNWRIESTSTSVKIDSTWYCVLGKLKGLLNENSFIEVEKEQFVEKWISLLLFVKDKLASVGYDENNLLDFLEITAVTNDSFKPNQK